MEVRRIKLRFSNAYLILGDRPVLVDTGSPNETEVIRRNLRNSNVEFSDLALILHTHAHSDHMGSTAEISAQANCPVAYHPLDQPIVDNSHNGVLKGIGLRGKIMARFFSNGKFDAVAANHPVCDGMSLDEFGVNATVLATPGHTPGSVSVLLPSGDAIIGDLLMGGIMGGAFLATRPNFHYFADNIEQAMESVDRVLSQASAKLYVGHGGPLSHRAIQTWRRKHQSWRHSFVA